MASGPGRWPGPPAFRYDIVPRPSAYPETSRAGSNISA